jgi:hypothetical protein
MQSLNNIEQLQGLIATLEIQEGMKKDYVASSAKHLVFINGELKIINNGTEIMYKPTDHFHTQVAEKLGIPMNYYRKMLQDGSNLIDENVNHWLLKDSKNFLIRTFENAAEQQNTARAFLSDRYSIIDNYQVLLEALESIKQTGLQIEVVNAELSDTRMYLKVVCPEIEVQGTELLKNYRFAKERGEGIISGFVLQNSEIGAGSFSIAPRAVVLACTNGLVSVKDQLKSIHLGSKMDELGFNQNQDVMRANLRLIKEQVKHAVKIFLSKDYLTKLVNVYTVLGEKKIEAPVHQVIEVVGKQFSISEERKANILKYFIEGGDTRRIGLVQAMTYECQSQQADQKHESEVASFQVLQDFNKIEAAAFRLKPSSN